MHNLRRLQLRRSALFRASLSHSPSTTTPPAKASTPVQKTSAK